MGSKLLVVFVALAAIFTYDLLRRFYGIRVPDGFSTDTAYAYRVIGFPCNIARDLCSLVAYLGLMDYSVTLRNALTDVAEYAPLNRTISDQLQINNTMIFGVSVRIYKPVNKTENEENKVKAEQLMPALIYYHGGGWTIGSLDAYDKFLRRLAVLSNTVVVGADYRQAPEYIYPTALTDCYNVAVGLLNNGSQYGVDVKRIMVGGDSAGGNLAAAVTHNLACVAEKHCSRQFLAGQILINPVLQMLDLNLPSYIESIDNALLSQRHMADFLSVYLTGSRDLTDAIIAGKHSKHLENTTYMAYVRPKQDMDKTIKDHDGKATTIKSLDDDEEEEVEVDDDEEEEEEVVEMIGKPEVDLGINGPEALISIKGSPLMAKDFRGTPQTLLITAEFDPLRDEGFLYAKRLKDANVDIVHKHYNSFHGFVPITTMPGPFSTKEGYEGMEDIVKFLERLKH